MNKKTKIVIVILFLVLSGIVYTKTIGFVGINLERCIKGYVFYGTYDKKVQNGNYVVFRFKGNKLFKKNAKLIKIVGCTAGEKIVSKGLKYYCIKNNTPRYIGTACTKVILHCPKRLSYNDITIPKGKLFVYGTAINSYDSKYWGLLNAKRIIGRAYKIF